MNKFIAKEFSNQCMAIICTDTSTRWVFVFQKKMIWRIYIPFTRHLIDTICQSIEPSHRWSASNVTGDNKFLVIHWPVLYNITGLVTQQRVNPTQYLKTYSLQYTRDGVTWLDHVDDEGNAIIHPALHTDYHQKTQMDFRAEIVARGLRIHAESYEIQPRLLFDLMGYAFGKVLGWMQIWTKKKKIKIFCFIFSCEHHEPFQ